MSGHSSDSLNSHHTCLGLVQLDVLNWSTRVNPTKIVFDDAEGQFVPLGLHHTTAVLLREF